jgi:hypothetical protein
MAGRKQTIHFENIPRMQEKESGRAQHENGKANGTSSHDGIFRPGTSLQRAPRMLQAKRKNRGRGSNVGLLLWSM